MTAPTDQGVSVRAERPRTIPAGSPVVSGEKVPDAPTPVMARFGLISRLYSGAFARSPLAPRLAHPHPVRRTGYEFRVRVAEIRPEAEGVVSVSLQRADTTQPLPLWYPGAHLDVILPSGRERQYSLCGDPADRTRYRIAVRLVEDGDGGSREIHRELSVGDRMTVRGPRNAFMLASAPSYLFVAGGIGITAILPMVHRVAAAGGSWTCVYRGRSRASMPFVEELEALPGGTVQILAGERAAGQGIADIIAAADPESAVYVCGPLSDAQRGPPGHGRGQQVGRAAHRAVRGAADSQR